MKMIAGLVSHAHLQGVVCYEWKGNESAQDEKSRIFLRPTALHLTAPHINTCKIQLARYLLQSIVKFDPSCKPASPYLGSLYTWLLWWSIFAMFHTKT